MRDHVWEVLVGSAYCGNSAEMEEDLVENKDSTQGTGEHK